MPPVVVSVNVMDVPEQMLVVVVVMGNVELVTETVVVTWQPVVAVNVTAEDPVVTPVYIPDAEPIVAMLVVPLLHVPPPTVALCSVFVEPRHTPVVPVIGAGAGRSVTVADPDIIAAHP